MSSPTPQDPWLLPVAPHSDQVPGGKRRIRPLPVVLVSLLALAVLCCGGATLITVFGPGKPKPVNATASAPAGRQIAAVPPTSSSPTPTPTSPASAPTGPASAASSPGPSRTMAGTVKPSRTTAAPKPTTPAPTTKSPAPKPKPTTPKPKPTTPKPAPTTARPPDQIVHAGAFCSPAGATGVTSKGKAMVCRSTATDSRNRWRAA